MEAFAALEASSLAQALRQSRWVYPAVNTAHVFGIALLFGAIAPMDLRLAGLWRRAIPLPMVLALLRPVAATGALLALITGALLFSVQASDYAALPLFWIKMALIGFGLAHALALTRALSHASPRRQKLAGATSLATWSLVIACGRMLGYL